LKKFLKIINRHENLWYASAGRDNHPNGPIVPLNLAIGSIWEIIEIDPIKYTIYNEQFDISTWMTKIEVEYYAEFVSFNYNEIWNKSNENSF